MRALILAITLLSVATIGSSQSFQGKLVYSVKYAVDTHLAQRLMPGSSARDFYQPKRYSPEITIYLKDSFYARSGYEKLTHRVAYIERESTLYEFYHTKKEKNKVRLTDTRIRYGTGETTLGLRIPAQVLKVDSTRIIGGLACKLILVDLGRYGSEEFWYHPDTLCIAPESFKNHSYEYLNKVLELTGCFPVEMVKMTGNFCTLTLTLLAAENRKLEAEIFDIPELTTLRDKDAREYYEMLNGVKGMRVKK